MGLLYYTLTGPCIPKPSVVTIKKTRWGQNIEWCFWDFWRALVSWRIAEGMVSFKKTGGVCDECPPVETWVFPKIMGFFPQIIHLFRVFHYKPSNLSTTIFGNTHIRKKVTSTSKYIIILWSPYIKVMWNKHQRRTYSKLCSKCILGVFPFGRNMIIRRKIFPAAVKGF